MDRNQAIGLVLITAIMMLYFIYFGGQQPEQQTQPKVLKEKELAKANQSTANSTVNDSILQQKFGGFAGLAKGEAKTDLLSNEDLEITFNSKGGSIDKVLLKKYKTFEKQPLYLINEKNNRMDFLIQTDKGEINLRDLYFTPTRNDSSIIYKAEIGPGQSIEQIYTIVQNSYIVKYNVKFNGLSNVVKNDPAKFHWLLDLEKTERDIKQSREKSTVNFYTQEDGFDNLSISNKVESKNVETPLKWVGLKEKFFTSAIIAENTLGKGTVRSTVNEADTVGVKQLEADLLIPTEDLKSGKGNYQFYFGPNKFQILNSITPGFHKNVDLGWPVINFINRFIVIPVFHFLENFIGNYGVIIIILVILLKLLLFPLSYKSYIGMAKMKVLKPEIDEIKEKYGDDLQKTQMETMELYRKVGINPLSGCVPVLLQMPILLAMFNFFPNSIELRQQAFLWAPDLSTYDAPIMLPFTIPFYGNHVSLFTLLMTISTIVYTWFNNQVSTVTGPMKTVSYVMPVVFMFVLNSFPAGLSFYYFVSNIITIGQQVGIRKFVDDDKIRRTLDENKKKIAANPNKKSRWMQRMEDAMKQREEAQKQKNKNNKKK